LADENPAVTAFRDDLGLTHSILSLALYQAGNPAEGMAEAREAVAIQQQQVDENPTDTVRRDVLAFHFEGLGDAARSAGQTGDAKIAYERAIALLERRVQEEPTNSRHRFSLSDATCRRGLTLRNLGDTAGAVGDIRRALQLCEGLTATHGLDRYNTACCYSAFAGMAGQAGSGVTATEAARAADKAMELLARSVAVGIRNTNEFRIESALDPLRSRDDFQLLMMDAAFPAEPFAAAR
jgi:tetratricopeptide (TPR) repeat protein